MTNHIPLRTFLESIVLNLLKILRYQSTSTIKTSNLLVTRRALCKAHVNVCEHNLHAWDLSVVHCMSTPQIPLLLQALLSNSLVEYYNFCCFATNTPVNLHSKRSTGSSGSEEYQKDVLRGSTGRGKFCFLISTETKCLCCHMTDTCS